MLLPPGALIEIETSFEDEDLVWTPFNVVKNSNVTVDIDAAGLLKAGLQPGFVGTNDVARHSRFARVSNV